MSGRLGDILATPDRTSGWQACLHAYCPAQMVVKGVSLVCKVPRTLGHNTQPLLEAHSQTYAAMVSVRRHSRPNWIMSTKAVNNFRAMRISPIIRLWKIGLMGPGHSAYIKQAEDNVHQCPHCCNLAGLVKCRPAMPASLVAELPPPLRLCWSYL